ncbi:argininosuccinate lyase [Marinicauda salina]|uniref:Argininosuccinate lyase n=1 Tax=Marinicauda salina TaxID=2135793 RepID=A0A2U2BQR4_9PROT|nr:lipoprotein [Marinicauda salina]PWE16352.1 argininosuccinate lyase [Marinicauda salina]
MKRLALTAPVALILLSGCGIRGDLERPPPLWGPDERTDAERAYETENGEAESEAGTETDDGEAADESEG